MLYSSFRASFLMLRLITFLLCHFVCSISLLALIFFSLILPVLNFFRVVLLFLLCSTFSFFFTCPHFPHFFCPSHRTILISFLFSSPSLEFRSYFFIFISSIIPFANHFSRSFCTILQNQIGQSHK